MSICVVYTCFFVLGLIVWKMYALYGIHHTTHATADVIHVSIVKNMHNSIMHVQHVAYVIVCFAVDVMMSVIKRWFPELLFIRPHSKYCVCVKSCIYTHLCCNGTETSLCIPALG